MTEAEKIAERFNWITSGIRVLMLTRRGKEGGRSNKPDRVAKKYVSMNDDEFVEFLEKLLEKREEGERIYATINPRDMDKAIRNFKQLQLDHDYQDRELRDRFYVDVWNRWISSLMKPNARASTCFLIDVDNDDRHGLNYQEVLKDLKEKEIKVWDKYETKNGHHIITEPYNYPKLTPELKKFDHVKVDALALIKY